MGVFSTVEVVAEGRTLVGMNDIGSSESTESGLSGEQFKPTRECIDYYQDMGVTLFVWSERSNVVYM